MVSNDKNPSTETQIKAQKEEKKIIVHSPRGKFYVKMKQFIFFPAPAFTIVYHLIFSHNQTKNADY